MHVNILKCIVLLLNFPYNLNAKSDRNHDSDLSIEFPEKSYLFFYKDISHIRFALIRKCICNNQ